MQVPIYDLLVDITVQTDQLTDSNHLYTTSNKQLCELTRINLCRVLLLIFPPVFLAALAGRRSHTEHLAGVGRLSIPLDESVAFAPFGLLELKALELRQGLRAVVVRQDPQTLMQLLEETPELLREALIDHGVHLGANEVVGVWEQDRPNEVMSDHHQQPQVHHDYRCYVDAVLPELLTESYNDHHVHHECPD